MIICSRAERISLLSSTIHIVISVIDAKFRVLHQRGIPLCGSFLCVLRTVFVPYFHTCTNNINFSLKYSSGNSSQISNTFGLQSLSEISDARSPPLRQISPPVLPVIAGFFNKGRDHCQSSFNGATARETT